MKSFLAVFLAVFGGIHLWAAFTRKEDPGSIKYPNRILGMQTGRMIHFFAGIFLVLFGLVFWFA